MKPQQQPAMGIPVGETNAPPFAPMNQPGGGAVRDFSTGLCDCCSDLPLCCLTCWCPCITFGRIAKIVDKGSSSCGVSGALYSLVMVVTGCQYNGYIHAQYGIPEDSCGDCCIHFCCESCALCQEYRELEHRDYDVSLGWQGNMDRQNQGMLPPSMPGGMTR
ncbi:protein PLANT CADMIUM RESISTANCE 2 isoform X2 [Spinacia oleracea]|uniref:Protein PLANT CADMIUM RESISTANCE 2 isoform X2 n=1 Tax=Spinacia oleracea TaxID=3562 RepID=A0ABM3RM37_SPIOL|nr:protein PLANT CADMIUM RESISTANCE 2-like isoform X2 [Spinacia oleracea]